MGVGKEQNIMYNIEESAKRLKELRRNKKVTQEQVANDLKISVDTVRKNEQGVRGLSIDIAVLYAEYYETSIDFIISGKVELNNQMSEMLKKYPTDEQNMALRILKGILENLE